MSLDFTFLDLPVGEMAFMDEGYCVGLDPELFFPENGKRVPREAQEACDLCEVRTECLQWALKYEKFGYWAGTTPDDRNRMRKRVA